MTNKQKNYEFGYKAGYTGKLYRKDLSRYPGYDEGWDHGNCDRPSLDEILPMDFGKEASLNCLL